MQPKKILLPTDFTAESVKALERGFDLCRQFDAEPHFVHVVLQVDYAPLVPPDVMTGNLGDLYEDVAKRATDSLQEIADRVAVGSNDSVVRVLTGPSVTRTLIDYTEEHDIDLMVVGTHGRTGAKRVLLGSEAERLVRVAPCPVLTVGPDVDPRPERPLRILGALDLADTSLEVARSVRELSELYSADAHFIHIVAPVILPAYVEGYTQVSVPVDNLLAQANEKLLEVVETAGVVDSTLRASFGDTAIEVVKYAKETNVDLIVVATHGRSGLPHLLLGSVADRIVRTAHCPVMTVRPSTSD